MSGVGERALVLEPSELRVLLDGCGIGGLMVPRDVGGEPATADDVARGLVGLSRDGLMPMGEDGLLDYDPGLREALEVLRDSRVCLVARTGGAAARPALLHLGAGLERAATISADGLRASALRLGTSPAGDACARLLELAHEAEATAAEVPADPQAWPWDAPDPAGALLSVGAFRRGEGEARARLLVMRGREGELAAVRDAAGTRIVPATADALMDLAREVVGDDIG